jgi:hypothetical protein
MISKSARHEHGDASATIPRTNADNMDISIKISIKKSYNVVLFFEYCGRYAPFKNLVLSSETDSSKILPARTRVEHEQ